jgi:predicted peptidase
VKLSTFFTAVLIAGLLVFPLAGCQTMGNGRGGEFVKRTVVVQGETHRYQVFVPKRRTAGERTPVVLFLHGSGERGSDGDKQLLAGLGPYVKARANDFPAIVVFPQVPEEEEWMGKNVDMALAALDAATREFDGDPKRTYLTGLSMGGYGTWETAIKAPARFAALVPICGGLLAPNDYRALYVSEVVGADDPYAALAARMKHLPIWIFHGGKDDVVLPGDDRKTFAALKAAAADVQYTEFPDAGHNSWDATYNHQPMWSWLFAQRKN